MTDEQKLQYHMDRFVKHFTEDEMLGAVWLQDQLDTAEMLLPLLYQHKITISSWENGEPLFKKCGEWS